MLPLLWLLLAPKLLNSMLLPLTTAIPGFTKNEPKLASLRDALKNSSFHVYSTNRKSPLQLNRLLSLADSTFVFGLNPKFEAQSGSLIIFDQKKFDEQKTRQVPKKGRGGNQTSKNSVSAQISTGVPVKMITLTLKDASPSKLYLEMIGHIYSQTFFASKMYGFSLLEDKPGSWKLSIMFGLDASDEFLSTLSIFIGPGAKYLINVISQVNVQLNTQYSEDQVCEWELRNHTNSQLIQTFTNYTSLLGLLERTSPAHLWDLMIVRKGEFERLRRADLSLLSIFYEPAHYHEEVIGHCKLMTIEPKSFLNPKTKGDSNRARGIYFYKRNNGFVIGALFYYSEADPALTKPFMAAHTKLGLDQFIKNYLMSGKLLDGNPLSVSFTRYKEGKRLESCPIRSLDDLIKLDERSWAKNGIGLSKTDQFILQSDRRKAMKKPFLIYAYAVFNPPLLSLALLRAYQLLLSDPGAWWASSIHSIVFEGRDIENNSGKLQTVTDCSVLFYQDDCLKGWDLKTLITDFLLTFASDGIVGTGILNPTTGQIISVQQDTSGRLEEARQKIANRLQRINGPLCIYKSSTESPATLPFPGNPDVGHKKIFETISSNEGDEKIRFLGCPSNFCDHQFYKHFGETNASVSFGILSQWIIKMGKSRTLVFRLPRSKITEVLAASGTFVFGSTDVLGSAFLGCILELNMLENTLKGGKKLGHDLLFTLFLDMESTPKNRDRVQLMLGLAEYQPIEILEGFEFEGQFGCGLDKLQHATCWSVEINDTEKPLRKTFSNLCLLEHYLYLLGDKIFPRLALTTDFSPNRETSKTIFWIHAPNVMELLFYKSKLMPGVDQETYIWDKVYRIDFVDDEPGKAVVKICFYLRPDVSAEHFQDMLRTRLHWIIFSSNYELETRSFLDLKVVFGSYRSVIDDREMFLGMLPVLPKEIDVDQKILVQRNSKDRPKNVKSRAYRAVVNFNNIMHIFAQAIIFLSGGSGGFWRREFFAVHIRKVQKCVPLKPAAPGSQDNPSNWEVFWILDDGTDMDVDHHKYLMVFAKVLMLCGQDDPTLFVGAYNYKTDSFDPFFQAQGLLDVYKRDFAGVSEIKKSADEIEREKEKARNALLLAKKLELVKLTMRERLISERAQMSQLRVLNVQESYEKARLDLVLSTRKVEEKRIECAVIAEEVRETEKGVEQERAALDEARELMKELDNELVRKENYVLEMARRETELQAKLDSMANVLELKAQVALSVEHQTVPKNFEGLGKVPLETFNSQPGKPDPPFLENITDGLIGFAIEAANIRAPTDEKPCIKMLHDAHHKRLVRRRLPTGSLSQSFK